MLHYRPIDIKRDKEIILELQCRINYECESPYFQIFLLTSVPK
jgi:hypothetical protein